MTRLHLPDLPRHLWVARAVGVAHAAHDGQRDGAGQDYIEHPAAVADLVTREPDWGSLTADERSITQALAWVHDAVEDSWMTVDDVTAWVMADADAELVTVFADGLRALTHLAHEPRPQYYARVRSSRVAWVVKRADVAHNSDPARLAALPQPRRQRLQVKYQQARTELGMPQL